MLNMITSTSLSRIRPGPLVLHGAGDNPPGVSAVGSYVLAEEETPSGYATAAPILITLEDVGHLTEIQSAEMGDSPCGSLFPRRRLPEGRRCTGQDSPSIQWTRRKTGRGAADSPPAHREWGVPGLEAVWVSGMDGVYEKEDAAAGNIPEGSQIGI